MEYIEYNDKYKMDVIDLIDELQNFISSIDKDGLNIKADSYKTIAFEKTMEEINSNKGKMIIAVSEGRCIGFIVGIIVSYDEFDYLEYKCPLKGEVSELIVAKDLNTHGVGSKLMVLMEDYFVSMGCEYISLDVFAFNDNAIEFYKKKGFHNRLVSMIKKI